MGCRTSAPALIKEYDAIAARIEEPPHLGAGSAAGSAVECNDREAVRMAAFLPVEFVEVAYGQSAGPAGLQGGVE
jgi:hypothetical protein